ncbi:MAG: MFS transporter [Pontibacterium sp.]
MNKNVILLSLCQALLMTGNVLLISVVALIGQSLTNDPDLTTLPVATQFIGLMLATIPASFVMKAVGRKNGFFLGNAIGILGALLCIYSLNITSFLWFCVGTFMLGVGIGFGTLYRFAAVEVCAPEQKSRAISLVMAGGVIAALIGPTLAVHSQEWGEGAMFQGAFIGLLVLYVLALVLLSFVKIPPINQSTVAGEQRSLVSIFTQPTAVIAVVSAMVGYAVMNLLMTSTPLAMGRVGHEFHHAAHVIEWHVLGMFVPSFFTGHLINRFGAKRMIYAGCVLMAACIAINLLGQTKSHFFFALLLLGVGWNFMFIPATHMLTGIYKEPEKAKAQATNEFLVFSLVTLSALSSGWLEASFGWYTMNLMMLPVILFTIALVFLMDRRNLNVLKD